MKLGFGLYRHQLNADHFRFARQCGATHLVIHWVDYFRSSRSNKPCDQPLGDDVGWGLAGDRGKLWDEAELPGVKAEAESHGLKIEAVENFDPAHWHDVLLDGPKKAQQLEDLKATVRTLGRVGIPIIGYNYSIAGVAGRVKASIGRGQAEVVGVDGNLDTPIPNGMLWNMVYGQHATPGTLPSVTHEELWRRHGDFLDALIPVAEEAGVTLAAHPDDPPMPTVRGQPRLVYQLVVRLVAALNFDCAKAESGKVWLTSSNADAETLVVTEESANSRPLTGRIKVQSGASAKRDDGALQTSLGASVERAAALGILVGTAR